MLWNTSDDGLGGQPMVRAFLRDPAGQKWVFLSPECGTHILPGKLGIRTQTFFSFPTFQFLRNKIHAVLCLTDQVFYFVQFMELLWEIPA